MSAPIHVWQPPMLGSTVGKQVVVPPLVGPKEVTGAVREQLLAAVPRDAGRTTTLIEAETLQEETQIQLVSAGDQQPNDVALASVARRTGADFVLRGEVMQSTDRVGWPGGSASTPPHGDASTLKISWRLTPLHGDDSPGGMPVVVDVDSALDRYPDLGLASDENALLTGAAVRDTFRLITPSVDRQNVQLEIPYVLPGSRQVRRGNAAARAGRWGQARQIWQDALEAHPTQVAALHNLAIAAAAGQDFSRAKTLARKAVRLQPSQLHQQTLVWIELKQRDYHEAFGLPDPPEGWFVTSGETSNAAP